MQHVDGFCIAADHPSLPGHFPGRPIVPSVVLLDAALTLLLARRPGRTVIGVPSVKFALPVRPGQNVKVSCDEGGDRIAFACTVDGQYVLRGSVTLSAALWCMLRAGWPLGRIMLVPITAWFLATSGHARAASRDYLRRVLGRPARLYEVARHFHTFACAVLDRVFLVAGPPGDLSSRTEGLEHVTAIVASGRGCILLGAHFGSFEVLRAVAQACPVPVWAL